MCRSLVRFSDLRIALREAVIRMFELRRFTSNLLSLSSLFMFTEYINKRKILILSLSRLIEY